jgi:hypothetical protein
MRSSSKVVALLRNARIQQLLESFVATSNMRRWE